MNIRTYLRRTVRHLDFSAYFLLAVFSGAIPAVCIRLRGQIIDSAMNKGIDGSQRFFVLLASFCVLFFLQIIFNAVMIRIAEQHKIRQSARLDTARLEKAAKTAFAVTETQQFHSLWQKSSEASALDDQMFKASGDIISLTVKLVISLIVLWRIDFWIAIGIIFLLSLGIFLNGKAAKKTDGFWVKYRENMRHANYFSSLLMQREYAAERKLFSFDDEIDRRYHGSYSKAKRDNAKLGRERFQIEAVIQILFAVYCIMLVLLLLRPLLAATITIGLFISAFYAAIELEKSAKQLYAAVYDFVSASRQMSSLFSFLDLEEDSSMQDAEPEREIRSIVFRDVVFTYPGMNKPVLKHVSFRLEPGRHYALVGENGCGKSTMVKLLAGLYAPDSGQVLVNDMPVHLLSPSVRQRLLTVVFQDFYRYPVTIRENVSLGRDLPADDQMLNDVFDHLAFHPAVINRADGYDSSLMPLFKAGAGLSGGEWQKMAVARCVLSAAPIAVLDEPNASLDPMAEAKIYEAYRDLLADKTTLFISHRLGSVRMSDEILVMRDGTLIAKAPHDVLLKECDYYAELFNTQKGLYDE